MTEELDDRALDHAKKSMDNPCVRCCYKKPYVNREGCAAEDQGECTKPLEWRSWQSGYQEGLAQGRQEMGEEDCGVA